MSQKSFLKLFTFYALSTTEASNINNIGGNSEFSKKKQTIYLTSNREDHQQERDGRARTIAIPVCAQCEHVDRVFATKK